MVPSAYETVCKWVDGRRRIIESAKGTFVVTTRPRLSTGAARDHLRRADDLLAQLAPHLEALAPVSPTVKAKPTATKKPSKPKK